MLTDTGAFGVAPGAPGVYLLPQITPPTLGVEALDVAAFVGVAPRGPAWEPIDDPTLADVGVTRARSVAVPVDSFDAYVQRFGAFEGPGLLPHAVAAFFAQGGRRAYIVRIVHNEATRDADGRVQPPGCAEYNLAVPGLDPAGQPVQAAGGGLVRLRARNEGTWGDGLAVTLTFTARPVAVEASEPAALVLAAGSRLPAGSVVRVRAASGAVVLRRVVGFERRGRRSSVAVDLVAGLDAPLGFVADRVEEVLAELAVIDRDPVRLRRETLTGLGLQPGHPRWLVDEVAARSQLVEVAGAVTGPPEAQVVSPLVGIDLRDAALPPVPGQLVRCRGGPLVTDHARRRVRPGARR